MLFCGQVNFFISSKPSIAATLLFALITGCVVSCTVPKNYQVNKPFIYKSAITLNSNLPPAQKQALKEALANQIDDSLKVRTVVAFGLKRKSPLFYNRLSKPPVFDTMYIGRSRTFMTALLNSRGYFNPTIRQRYSIDTVGDQQRVSLRFTVSPGIALRVDSVGYDLQTPELQQLTLESRGKALVKKNETYSVQNITNEMERLLALYRDNGFYKISKEDLYAEQDTVVAELIDPTLDPFEQLALLDSLQKRKKDPTINIVFKQRTPKDSSHIKKYVWGKINVYPDKQIIGDTSVVREDSVKVGRYTFFRTNNKFKFPFIARNISIRPGAMYRQSDYFKTISTFTNLGAWQQVDINLKERLDSLRYLDAAILLYPAKRQSLNIDVETSRNTNEIFSTGSLFGIGLNLGIKNRNAFRESITSTSSLRFGIELGTDIIQTFQASFSHNIYVPRFIVPFKIKPRSITSPRTIINFNMAYTDRRNLYDVRSVNTSWGYDWSRKNHSWQYIPLNFEFTSVNKTRFFIDSLEKNNPAIGLAFNNGLIISQILTYTTGRQTGRNLNFFRARLESSGALTGLLKNLDRGDLRRFLKLDLEYKYFITHSKSSWAFRAFAGYGYVYGKTGNQPENNLPFFKAYFGGGPYSMRAWAVRRLGLGSTYAFDTARIAVERFGDMKLEGNIEYRFNLGTVLGIKIRSALFTDIGNIWGKSFDAEGKRIDSTEFNLGRLYTDLAVGAGTSLRLDFDFFLIRLDWAYQIKNPVYARENEGWFHKLQIRSGQFQLGVGYPF